MGKNKKVRLSPSRVDSLQKCTWNYAASYYFNLPRFANDGNRRGNVVHGILEHLVKKKHYDKYKDLLKTRNPFKNKVVARYLELFAKKEELNLDTNVLNKYKNGVTTHREMVIDMIMVALDNDFLGKKDDEIIPEQRHNIFVEIDGKKVELIGFIDKTFIRRDSKGNIKEIEIVDYKTSASKFEEKKMSSNLQGLFYQFFVKNLYPEVKKIKFKFLFLRFPKNPWIEVPVLTDASMNGFKRYLLYLKEQLSDFDEEFARSNFAKSSYENSFLCGKHGNKQLYDKATKTKSDFDEPNFICPYRDPFDYYAVIDEEGNNVRSAMSKEELKTSKDEVIVKRRYGGCPAWHYKA